MIFSKCNSFPITNDLLNSENFKAAITQLCKEPQVWNFTVIADPKIGEYHIETKYSKCNSFQVISDLLNSDNVKVTISYAMSILLCYILLCYS